MLPQNQLHPDLNLIKTLVYDKCGLGFTNFKQHLESAEYAACSFELDGKKIEYRTSKITPTKTGQFVTIWKRNPIGITEPFNILDDFDFIVITSRSGNKLGQFIFPKAVLAAKGIISQNGKDGKRGIRVYPPWDIANNKQAAKTQSWQSQYFVQLERENSLNLDEVKKFIKKYF